MQEYPIYDLYKHSYIFHINKHPHNNLYEDTVHLDMYILCKLNWHGKE